MKMKMDMENPTEEKAMDEEMDSMEVDQAAQCLMEAEKVKANAPLYKAALAKIGDKKKHAEAVLGTKPKITSISQIKKASYSAKD